MRFLKLKKELCETDTSVKLYENIVFDLGDVRVIFALTTFMSIWLSITNDEFFYESSLQYDSCDDVLQYSSRKV